MTQLRDCLVRLETEHSGRHMYRLIERLFPICRSITGSGVRKTLDIIGEDTNEAWIVTLEIPEGTILLPDPSDEGQYYNGRWVVHEGPLAVQIIEVVHIPNVQRWESGSSNVPT